MEAEKVFTLPEQIIGPADVGRVYRELESVNDAMMQLKIRSPQTPISLPKTSELLDQIAKDTNVNLLDGTQRERLMHYLNDVKTGAPQIHISFSVEPSPEFTQKIVAWLRKEVSPIALVIVGLQPNIGVGCMIRTTNKYFDLSLKQSFKDHRDVLVKGLIPDEYNKQPQAAAVT